MGRANKGWDDARANKIWGLGESWTMHRFFMTSSSATAYPAGERLRIRGLCLIHVAKTQHLCATRVCIFQGLNSFAGIVTSRPTWQSASTSTGLGALGYFAEADAAATSAVPTVEFCVSCVVMCTTCLYPSAPGCMPMAAAYASRMRMACRILRESSTAKSHKVVK